MTDDPEAAALADCIAILLDDVRRNRAQRTAQAAQQHDEKPRGDDDQPERTRNDTQATAERST